MRWITADPSATPDEQTAQIAALVEMTSHQAGMEQLVIIPDNVDAQDYLRALAPNWVSPPMSCSADSAWAAPVEPTEPAPGEAFDNRAGSRLIVKTAGGLALGIGVQGPHPIAVYLDGVALTGRLAAELPEIVRWDVPGSFAMLANQPRPDDVTLAGDLVALGGILERATPPPGGWPPELGTILTRLRAHGHSLNGARIPASPYVVPEPGAPLTHTGPDGRWDQTALLAKVPGSDAETFIQWKGTDVCLDFYCPCGHHGHLDAEFAHAVRCPACGAIYELGTQVLARRADVPYHEPKWAERDDRWGGTWFEAQRSSGEG